MPKISFNDLRTKFKKSGTCGRVQVLSASCLINSLPHFLLRMVLGGGGVKYRKFSFSCFQNSLESRPSLCIEAKFQFATPFRNITNSPSKVNNILKGRSKLEFIQFATSEQSSCMNFRRRQIRTMNLTPNPRDKSRGQQRSRVLVIETHLPHLSDD